MLNCDQPERSANIEAIVDYFKSGIEDKCEAFGIELEHTLVNLDGTPVSYSDQHGVAWLLTQLQSTFPHATYDSDGDIVGVWDDSRSVTIEPASQLELSAGPFTSLAAARKCFEEFEQLVGSIMHPHNVRVLKTGYHPTARAADLELIPKRRYKFMNAYLGSISPFGVCMMRGSASTQVAIDYSSVEDCLKKLRVAFALVPIFSLICDNSPIFEGRPRTHELVRTKIWKHCDPDRCNTVKGVMDPSFTLEDYASYILDTPAILVRGEKDWEADARTFGEIYAEVPMTRKDVVHACSMFFTDVRLKTYIEIRPADALPVQYAIAYAALIKGLFYDEGNLDMLAARFADVRENDISAAKSALMDSGYEATVYGRPAAEIVDLVMSAARLGLSEEERPFLEPLNELAARRTTLARLF